MSKILECQLNSVWDGGEVTTTAAARLDATTGRVFDVRPDAGDPDSDIAVDNLVREYIDVPSLNGQFGVRHVDGDEFEVEDLSTLRAALSDAKV